MFLFKFSHFIRRNASVYKTSVISMYLFYFISLFYIYAASDEISRVVSSLTEVINRGNIITITVIK